MRLLVSRSHVVIVDLLAIIKELLLPVVRLFHHESKCRSSTALEARVLLPMFLGVLTANIGLDTTGKLLSSPTNREDVHSIPPVQTPAFFCCWIDH